ncbi:hypothetical protein COEREDRAFT_80841 [Coemansia reversa NRRL 1564]|uniref:Uncharacterized protein n=1 Tax=Coemansia reversa (strain ATCC 12441 / NRRL 1564) TaxID=763665 RepID=A0A2G5BDU0_COERN|nr:hypothetical protein COEREDRAFT_80841 [Coemansia reversa NRRL 1564]|eukprot:PIA17152.1 hypothetical protein COEREDRAFT_80841 [Coemansia reversa NRRL 1564]
MHASSPLLATPVTPVSVKDPLLEILSAVKRHQSEKDVIEQIHVDYTASPDIRASLRLVPLGYMDALAVSFEAATVVVSTSAKQTLHAGSGQNLASGSQLLQLFWNHAIDGQDYAAVILTDILDNADAAESIPPQKIPALCEAVTNMLLTRVRNKEAEVDVFAGLLRALDSRFSNSQSSRVLSSEWVEGLVLALVEAVTDIPVSTVDAKHNGTQVLCLMAQLLTQHRDEATNTMAKLKSLRKLARHLIKLLSQPSPLLAAPALHVLTRILLHPHHQTTPTEQQTALTILAKSLGGKLFDEDHIDRTLVLIADMCLNCHAADELTNNPTRTIAIDSMITEDLRVLNAVAGVIHAIVDAQASDVSARFFKSTAITPAIDHLVSMAKLDRRYLGPLLHMVNPILMYSNGDSTLPLIASLFVDRPNNHISTTDESITDMPSIVDEIFDAVLLGVEDAIDTVPRFASFPENTTANNELVKARRSDARLSSIQNLQWPRVSCEERDCGWFVNCSQSHRQYVHDFLRLLLSIQPTTKTDRSVAWINEFLDTVTQVLHTFLLPAVSVTKETKVVDPFGTFAHFALDADDIKTGGFNDQAKNPQSQQKDAEHLVSVLGTYYWVVRPVMLMVTDLVTTSKHIATCWHRHMGESDLFCIDRWAQALFQKIGDKPESLLGKALYTEMGQILALADDLTTFDYPDSRLLHSIQRTVTTPDSASSSSTASPRQDRDAIAIDDLRAANYKTGMGILSNSSTMLQTGKTKSSGLAQAAVLRHWARTCEMELVTLLVLCRALAVHDNDRIEQVKTMQSLLQRSRFLIAPPAALEQPTMPYFLDSLSLGATVQMQNMKQRQSHQTLLTRRLHEQRSILANMEDENSKMQNALNQAEGNRSDLHILCNNHQEEIQQLKKEKEELDAIIIENQHSKYRLETDINKWKEEYSRTHVALEQSELMGRESRQQLLQLTEKQQLLQESFSKKQDVWDEKQLSMTENIRKLEIALSEAMARLRELESQYSNERNTNNQLNNQVNLMNSKLTEYSKVAESLYAISRLPQ